MIAHTALRECSAVWVCIVPPGPPWAPGPPWQGCTHAQVGAVGTCPWGLGDALHKLLAVVPHLPVSGQQ